jgi:hypothetical protein
VFLWPTTTLNSAGADFFRFYDDGKIVEHRAVLQPGTGDDGQRRRHVQPAHVVDARCLAAATDGANPAAET